MALAENLAEAKVVSAVYSAVARISEAWDRPAQIPLGICPEVARQLSLLQEVGQQSKWQPLTL